ncbi:MAG: hypothetical protein PHF54_03340 [Candidatus Pacebacteria bacterium]|nr:hypothetical protein [Candidatus Paceibacterota bacterium]
MKNIDFKLLEKNLLKYAKKLKKIPTIKEIQYNENLCSAITINKLFLVNYNMTYIRYLELLGYKISKKKSIKYKEEKYEYYCNLFIEKCNKLGRVLKCSELIGKNKLYLRLPNARWFIKYCPDKNVKLYKDFLNYLELKPGKYISKEYAIKAIYKKREEVNRNLMYDDFRNPDIFDGISISVINRIWGTFNNMLMDLNLPINQENMINKKRTIEELKQNIINLCNYIYKIKGIKNISKEDINNCEWCLHSGTYNSYFKKHLNMSLGDYIKSIGFIPNQSGMGMIYEFEDGEITTSQWEYICTKFFKDNGFKYERNIKYKTFILNYKGNKDCDYVFNINNIIWYVEIAGILDYTRQKSKTYVRNKYKINLEQKEKMLKDNNLNYNIIYPHELVNKSLKEVFSFLF